MTFVIFGNIRVIFSPLNSASIAILMATHPPGTTLELAVQSPYTIISIFRRTGSSSTAHTSL
jgi:hypothetical protein